MFCSASAATTKQEQVVERKKESLRNEKKREISKTERDEKREKTVVGYNRQSSKSSLSKWQNRLPRNGIERAMTILEMVKRSVVVSAFVRFTFYSDAATKHQNAFPTFHDNDSPHQRGTLMLLW